MKKFIALILRATVDTKINDILIITMISIHFTRNLANGGIPAKLAIIINSIHFFISLFDSVFSVFVLKFFRMYIIIITAVQYIILNHKKIFVSIVMAMSIHPRLNTEEYLMISIKLVLFSCSSLPINIDKIINNISIKLFIWNKIKKAGANFCQVIMSVSWYFFMIFLILMNHSCNGAAAIFNIRDMRIIFWVIRILYKFFVCIDIIMKTLEAIDWIIKYFILHSIILFDFFVRYSQNPAKS